jgi:hypothetical protein
MKTSEETKKDCNSGLYDLLNDMDYITSRGICSLLSSKDFQKVQDRYQLPTAFDSEDTHEKAAAFAVGSVYWLMMTTIIYPFLVFLKM